MQQTRPVVPLIDTASVSVQYQRYSAWHMSLLNSLGTNTSVWQAISLQIKQDHHRDERSTISAAIGLHRFYYSIMRQQYHTLSRLCALAHYAVLEPNANKINRISEISSNKPLNQTGCRFKYITTSTHGVDMHNFI